MKKFTIVTILAIVLGFLAGYYLALPPKGFIVINPGKVMYFEPTSQDNAHTMSVAFRRAAGYCNDDGGTVPGSCGVFEFREETARDIVAAIEHIKQRNGVNAVIGYRAIFGLSAAGESRLIIAGLDRNNLEIPGSETIIDGRLPCPLYCDIERSSIIMGAPGRQNSCGTDNATDF